MPLCLKRIWKWLEGIGGLYKEEHGYACKGYDGAYEFSHRDFLLVDYRVRKDDEHRGERHQGGGYARMGVLHGHERQRHSHKGAEECGEGGVGHALFVVKAFPHLPHLFATDEYEGEAHQPCQCPNVGAGKRHEHHHALGRIFGDGQRIVLEADFAQHQPYTLSHSRTYAEEYTFQRQFDLHTISLLHHDGECDAAQCDTHGKPRGPTHLLAQKEPTRDAGNGRCQRHEKLSVFGTKDYVGIEETKVAKHISHHT